jgi:S1-C subfamily serine protease
LFRDSKGQGPVTVELYEVGPQGVRIVETVEGRVISYDLERDIAFVSIRPTRPVCVAQVAPSRTPIAKGDLAASVGCSNGENPTVVATRITYIDRYLGPPNIETSGAPPIGRSGGGLFNEQGQLVGVCNAADKEGNRGLYAGLESIHDELDRLGLRDVFDKPLANATADAGVTNSGVRGQEPSEASPQPSTISENLPDKGLQPGSPNADAKTLPLKAIEQATLEEVVGRAATKKVTCIIQSDEPGVENEIITIENVSNEFVEALAARRRREAAVNASGPVVQASRDDARYNR